MTPQLPTACSTVDYWTPQFAERARYRKIIAEVALEIVPDANFPDHLFVQQIARIAETESVTFRHVYHDRLVRLASVHDRHPVGIEIQRVETTNRLEELFEITCRRPGDQHAH